MFRLKPKDESEKEKYELLNKDLMRRQAQLNEMEESLPKKSGTYLKIILGSVNVSFLNKQERYVCMISLNLSHLCVNPLFPAGSSTRMTMKSSNWL